MDTGGGITMSSKELSRLEIMEKLSAGALNQQQAADTLRISVRQVKRIWKAFKMDGARGLISKKRGREGNHRLSEEVKIKALRLISEKYIDFGPTLAHEKLTQCDELQLSIGTVRGLMITHGIWKPKKAKRVRVFQMRARRPREGEMIQVDGSPHSWFEDRGPKCTLLVYADDATSKIMQLKFVESESLQSYFSTTQEYIEEHGRPLALYTDKHGVFRVNRTGALSGRGVTQFGRAMEELDIRLIFANTPQAKGRVERCNRTLQDRLVKELRLQNISTKEEGNAFLPAFVEGYNRRFAVVAKNPANAHRELRKTDQLDRIFSIKEKRKLSKELMLQYKNIIYQIATKRSAYTLRGSTVVVRESMEGEVTLFHNNTELNYTLYHSQQAQCESIEAKRLEGEWERLMKKSPRQAPKTNHPWKSRAIY